MRPSLPMCLLVLAAVTGVASAQDSQPQNPKPDPNWRKEFTRPTLEGSSSGKPLSITPRRMSMPSKIFPSGLSRKIYPNGFAHIPFPAKERPRRFPVIPVDMGKEFGWGGTLAPRPQEKIGGYVPDWITKIGPDFNLLHTRRQPDVGGVPDRTPAGIIRTPQGMDPDTSLVDHKPASVNDAPRRVFLKERHRSGSSSNSPKTERTRVPMVKTDPSAADETRKGMNSADSAVPESERPALEDLKLVGTKPSAAAEQLRTYIKTHPDDFTALRMLALTQLLSKNPTGAASMLLKAYTADPLLAREPFNPQELGLDSGKMPGMIAAAQAAAKGSKTPQSWLLVTVLQQAQGQKAAAQASLENARKANLDPDLADMVASALAGK